MVDKKLSDESLKTLTEQLIERLIMSSIGLSGPSAEVPEGHELWKLCLSGEDQEIFVPSDTVEGGLPMLPGIVLADMRAPKSMPSVVAQLIEKEHELERMRRETHEALYQVVGSLLSGILHSALENTPDGDAGFGRAFESN